jgi:hypothetical protein
VAVLAAEPDTTPEFNFNDPIADLHPDYRPSIATVTADQQQAYERTLKSLCSMTALGRPFAYSRTKYKTGRIRPIQPHRLLFVTQTQCDCSLLSLLLELALRAPLHSPCTSTLKVTPAISFDPNMIQDEFDLKRELVFGEMTRRSEEPATCP